MPRSKPVRHRKLCDASILSEYAWLEIAAVFDITKREVQIINGVFDNLHKTAIPHRIGIPAHTTHTHLNRLFKKLNVTTRTELILRVIEQMIALTLSETGVLPPICHRYRTTIAATTPHQQSGRAIRHQSPMGLESISGFSFPDFAYFSQFKM